MINPVRSYLPAEPSIVPLRPGTKIPAVKWRDLPPGTTVADFPDTRARAMLTGTRSGGIVVIDVDSKHEGFATLERLEAGHGRLPETLSVRSPTGGLHLYFRHPGRFRSVASVHGNPGVDIRGEGGIVVLPGSEHPRGGIYEIEDARPVALLPPGWADWLPRAGEANETAGVAYVPAEDLSELRSRLEEVSRGRRGEGWAALRRAIRGERMFRIASGPGPADLPVVAGVDDFVSKRMLWPLAATPEFASIPPEQIAEVLDPAFAILRADCQAIGQESKFTRTHVAAKWAAALPKAQAELERAQAFTDTLQRALEAAQLAHLPAVVQHGKRFYLLDDREEGTDRYTVSVPSDAVAAVARQVWGDKRPIEKLTPTGLRDMSASEIVKAYGQGVERVDLDYTATRPRVDDLTLVLAPEDVGARPDPLPDDQVAEWLDALDPSGMLLRWIFWSATERCGVQIPALVLVGGAHVGKSLFANAIAVAGGMASPSPLARALGKFNSVLMAGPFVFSDEGIPRGPLGVPMTEELRRTITEGVATIEQKGSDSRVRVRGYIRAMMAANRYDRIFAGRHALSAEDVEAITRRMCVIDLFDAERVARASRLAVGLGAFEGDPGRLRRVARHFRAIQCGSDQPMPTSIRASVERALRAEPARPILDLLEDRIGLVPWLYAHGSTLWLMPGMLARAAESDASIVLRALAPYVTVPGKQYRTHPATGARLEARERWVGLSIEKLTQDGVALNDPEE